ncbi:UDP-N-acetylglucosamine 1-carboxyvinyltransferase [Candidatus Woesebacteria bacterium GWC2_33_12]|uniref:UDP-N-acetylglucosamine 1-carboxyvinyltransferase n=1 Tax=Candidatus Woesebacteria bacterium GW2011_GWB1_33_22 TaxID=1618566 RepID=A0A0F9ZMT3_9BACT|nr:MAG: UDP-N-acetylglucosamine 1-carboxyvinyltransferase [Candidatus Woesebacteria bacterium GW2011_GWC2_33_12]KKP42696.1 MAG: UDP-N-acetylglucosamine 1-carboxyvinyltransferase [Candidatus Woesebacteria bacterium GW2011_GWA2_33_20]KKP45529.1 MAG: UDP-N-acetylglucosamine 1-carboxyvinyltransferase [Candidatus Woesebacteria bacterium GW2011_GWB1_33_22]KKP47401.1 MAG: UDP-N-acetylglucosamine 1-carboxyvinyltransferase [Microgenomates group bacterium GW2011_GWC1_33_28]KKP51147.1 MAG: UDP-N-acetylglu
MAKFLITGGKKLEGEIDIFGNKNSALKLIPAVLVSASKSILTNVPNISDVRVLIEIIEKLGAKTSFKDNVLEIDATTLNSYEPDPDLCSKIRASVVLAAPLLVRFGKAVLTPPGGDQIGDRLLDTHFSMMQKLGANFRRENGKFYLTWDKKIGGKIFLEEASVTATEMGIIMASSMNEEVTIEDAAAEPHVGNLIDLLVKMGAKIIGRGTNTLTVSGGKLNGVEHKVMADHIEGGTFAIASAITGGKIKINNFEVENYHMILNYLGNMGVSYKIEKNSLIVLPSKLIASRRKFQTRPWPGFPTDLMSPFIVLATQTAGTVLCHDWMYEWRMFFVDDLIGMGANIFIADPHRVIISGPTKLMADRLFCKDIRAGISVILAALAAEGTSTIENVEVVDRGYQNIEDRLRTLGASIVKQ